MKTKNNQNQIAISKAKEEYPTRILHPTCHVVLTQVCKLKLESLDIIGKIKIFFFLIDKGNSLKAKRLKRVYTKYTKIQRIKKQKVLTLTWWLTSLQNQTTIKYDP